MPQQEADEGRISMEKLRGYGLKSLSPFVDLLHKYQDELLPYIEAVEKGLQSGADSLAGSEGPSSVVSGWFKEAAGSIQEARSKISSQNASDFIDYIDAQSGKHPSLMFSASYLAGLFFGKVGRHFKGQEGADYGTKH
jgi:hypothetical protein